MSLLKDAKPEDFKVLGQENNEVETVDVQSEDTTEVVKNARVVEETAKAKSEEQHKEEEVQEALSKNRKAPTYVSAFL